MLKTLSEAAEDGLTMPYLPSDAPPPPPRLVFAVGFLQAPISSNLTGFWPIRQLFSF